MIYLPTWPHLNSALAFPWSISKANSPYFKARSARSSFRYVSERFRNSSSLEALIWLCSALSEELRSRMESAWAERKKQPVHNKSIMESEKSISSNSYTHVSIHLGHLKVITFKILNTGHGILSMTSQFSHMTTGLGTYQGKQQNKKKITPRIQILRTNMEILQGRRQVKLLLFQKYQGKATLNHLYLWKSSRCIPVWE